MKKIYVAKNASGRYYAEVKWVKDINKAEIYYSKSVAKIYGTPILVNIVEAE